MLDATDLQRIRDIVKDEIEKSLNDRKESKPKKVVEKEENK